MGAAQAVPDNHFVQFRVYLAEEGVLPALSEDLTRLGRVFGPAIFPRWFAQRADAERDLCEFLSPSFAVKVIVTHDGPQSPLSASVGGISAEVVRALDNAHDGVLVISPAPIALPTHSWLRQLRLTDGREALHAACAPTIDFSEHLYWPEPYSDLTHHDFWALFCIRNDATWILKHSIWSCTWYLPGGVPTWESSNRGSHWHGPGLFLPDERFRGFILLNQPSVEEERRFDFELYFVLVERRCRGKGVLREMLTRLRARYPGKRVWLECKQHLVPMWCRLGVQRANPSLLSPKSVDFDGYLDL